MTRHQRWVGAAALAWLLGMGGGCTESTVVPVPVERIEITGASGPLAIGGTVQLRATPIGRGSPLKGRAVTWTSSDAAVATVDGNGLVRGLATGSVNITASSEDQTGTTTLTVQNPTPSLSSVNPSSVIAGGAGFTLVVRGTSFVASSVVRWNGEDRQTRFVSSSELQATITPSDVSRAGTAQVAVFTPAPGGGESNRLPFVVARATSGPVQPGAISGGAFHTCGLTTSGAAHCWGFKGSGQLGDGSAVNQVSSVPVQVQGGPRLRALTAGAHHTCGVADSGQAFCWGDGGAGALGTGEMVTHATPTQVQRINNFRMVAAGEAHTCGVTDTGIAYCWGYEGSGQLGNGSVANQSTPAPSQVVDVTGFASVTAGRFHSCGLTTAGVAYCWGDGGAGALGNGGTVTTARPVRVQGGHTFAVIVAGGRHSCGLTGAGVAFCWGSNESGQLGNGVTAPSVVPVQVQGVTNFVAIGAGRSHTCGITTTGAAYCWGNAEHGQLGDGSTSSRSLPVQVSGTSSFVAVGVGANHSCGITSSGTAFCWGQGDFGQLGNRATANSSTPVQVQGVGDFILGSRVPLSNPLP